MTLTWEIANQTGNPSVSVQRTVNGWVLSSSGLPVCDVNIYTEAICEPDSIETSDTLVPASAFTGFVAHLENPFPATFPDTPLGSQGYDGVKILGDYIKIEVFSSVSADFYLEDQLVHSGTSHEYGAPSPPPQKDVNIEIFKLPELTPVLTDSINFCTDNLYEFDPGNYRVKATAIATGLVKELDKTVREGETTLTDVNFTPTPLALNWLPFLIGIPILGGAFYLFTRKEEGA